MPPSSLTTQQELLIEILLGDAIDLIELIAIDLPNKASRYLTESLFLTLRQLGYFFISAKSPLTSQIGTLSANELNVANIIKDIRDAIGHRESENNFLDPGMIVIASFIFKNNDVEIQYGKNNIFLLKDIIEIYKKYRMLFANSPELPKLKTHPAWESAEYRLAEAEKILITKLSNPQSLLIANL